MNNKILRSLRSRVGLLLLAAVMLIAAGCQAIGGLDFNKALIQSLKVTSSESKGSIQFNMQLNEAVLEEYYTEDERDMYRLFSDITLKLDEVKQQDSNHISIKGKAIFGQKYDIGFAIKQNKETLVVELEGAKSPFVLDLTSEGLLEATGQSSDQLSPENEQSLTELGFKLTDLIGGYAINNLPNPKGLQVAPVTESINGQQVGLLHASFDMNGEELLTWLEGYVDALLKDQAGLKATVKDVVELLSNDPVLWDVIGMENPFVSDTLDAPTADEIADEMAQEITDFLSEMQEEFQLAKEEGDLEGSPFTDALKLKANFYVDSKLDIRKSVTEVSYTDSVLSEEEEEEYWEPFTGFTLKVENEQWNVGGAVVADKAVAGENAVDGDELTWLEGYELLSYFDETSDLYSLLKNDLHIARQTYTAYNDDYYNPPIIVPGYITLVSLRDVGEAFGAEISYDAATKTATLYDALTDTTIQVQLNSDEVVVNGAVEKWPFPVTKINGSTYVPARKLAEALGADISWETIYEDIKELVIEREL
ncbi:copper amine oxidase N-terminal domain-containing protein [Paenibacillus sp. CAU 1782]